MKNAKNLLFKVFSVLVMTSFFMSCDDPATHNAGEIVEEDEAVIDEHVHEDEVPDEHKHDEDMRYNHEHDEDQSE